MLERRETLTAIAELAGVKVSEVRAMLKSAGAQTGAAPRAARRGGAHQAAAKGTGAALGDATNPIGVGGTA